MSSSASLGDINPVHIRMVKTLYVAGPFIGATPWHTHLDAQRAEEVCAKIWDEAAENVFVLSPHQNSRNMVGVAGERAFVVGYLKAVDICDASLFLKGWEKSKGTKGEILRAYEMDKRMFFDDDEVIRWAKGHSDDFQVEDMCGLCGNRIGAADPNYCKPYTICISCLAHAWPEARYQPETVGDILRTEGLIK